MKPFYKIILFLTLASCYSNHAGAQKKKPDSDELLKNIKTEIEVRRNYPKALELSKLAAGAFPDDIDFRFLLGRTYFLNNQLDKAQEQLDKVIAQSPGYKDAYTSSANVQLGRNKGYNAIRYINMGLSRFPRDRDLHLKKLNIYQSIGDFIAGDQQADTLRRIFPRDTAAARAYTNYHNESGTYLLKAGNLPAAARHFEQVLLVAPKNGIAEEGILAAKMKSGDDQGTLNTVNAGLQQEPGSYELLMKRLGLLQELKRYPEALETVQQLIKKFPADPKIKQLETDLKLEAARYYKLMDPYYQYQSVLDQNPGNKEALDNIIGIALSRGMNNEAMSWINYALKKNSSDNAMLTKKMSLLQQQGNFVAAAAIAQRLNRNGSKASRDSYVELLLLAGRDFAGQQLFDSALAAYNKVLNIEPANEQALNSAINILSGQKNYTASLKLMDKALSFYPRDQNLTLKKASILQDDEQYAAAVSLLETLQSSPPENPRILSGLLDAYLNEARQRMKLMDYDGAAQVYNKILVLYPDNREALTGIINIALTIGGVGYESALAWTDKALVDYPGDKDFLLKRSEAFLKLRRYSDAAEITDTLRRKYPFNIGIREAYLEQMNAEATYQRGHGDTTAAIAAFNHILEVNPMDSNALLGKINIYAGNGNYDAALAVCETALKYYPQQPAFMIKRAGALEMQQRYKEATLSMDTIAKLYPDRLHYQDYLASLRSKTYHNQIGISYLNSKLDSVLPANIATLQYMRYGKWGSLTGRLNFAGRSIGTGLQIELESYVNHNKKWYSFISVAAANQVVFARYKANYSLFHSFSKGWEAELGGRFLNFDSINAVSGVASLAKYIGDFWLNVRGYVINVSDKQYFAGTLTARQYLNNKTDYFYTVLGYGNSPDDFSRSFQLSRIINFTTYSIGAGYRKMFNHRNIVSLSGTWYNQRLSETHYRNQYDIYLSFYRNF